MSFQKTFLIIGLAAFAFYRLRFYLGLFQQGEYDGTWFAKHFVKHQWFDCKCSIAILSWLACGLFLATGAPEWLGILLLAGMVFFESRKRRVSKKELVWTPRALRVFIVSYGLFLIMVMGCLGFWRNWFLLVFVHAIPLTLICANGLLKPIEMTIQARILGKAGEKMRATKTKGLKVVGITGSYGKTSVKHILHHVLSSCEPTLMTPGSVNTKMGISRIILEHLKPQHRYFIAEMGAYGKHSIRNLCKLVMPDFGIVHSIGAVHYERFRSLENVVAAKFELFDVLSGNGGACVVNLDLIDREAFRFLPKNPHNYFTISSNPNDGPHFLISNARQTAKGIACDITFRGDTYSIEAPLFGLHQVQNLASAFAFCVAVLEIPVSQLLVHLKTVPQIPHRLEVKAPAGDITIIDNAYNSNPSSFRSGLALLNDLGKKDGRKILVTPGMIELGEIHAAEHFNLGRLAAQMVDVALVIQPKRIPTFVEGWRKEKTEGLYTFTSFREAKAWIDENVRAGDSILYENDLPDFYETRTWL